MNFEEVFPAVKQGKKITRFGIDHKTKEKFQYWIYLLEGVLTASTSLSNNKYFWQFSHEELLANDWEIE